MEAAERVEVLLAAMALRRIERADGQPGFRPLSTAEIRAASAGEVTSPGLLSCRTQQPEPGGLLCERIFGSLDDLEARSRRLGHVELPVPVVHPLFAARVARALGLEPREVELLEAGGAYLLEQVPEGVELLAAGKVLPAPLYRDAKAVFRERLEGACGAEGVRGAHAGREAGPEEGRPEWMVLEAVPVLPPGLREPSGEGAEAGLEETETVLYRRLIGRCQRMRKLIELEVPESLRAAEAGLLRSMLHALFRNEDLPRAYWGLDGPVRGLLGRLRREAAAAGVALPPLG